tara:strand:- start:743 stop:910 length:168 start_codon:yes stop_codon:yes gene_type:complete
MTKRNEKEILAAFDHMAINELKGTVEKFTTYDSMGRQSRKIVIEYDVITKKRNVS